MSGCDFNTNMYGYGVAKSYTLLKKYGSIDLLPKNLDITCLNHIRCREIFTYISSSQLLLHNYSNDNKLDDIKLDDIKLDNEIFTFNKKSLNNATEYFKMIGLISYINRFTTIYNNFEISHSIVENTKAPLKLKILPKS
jgi:5'-3' exonuclease